jgi:uncharacterized membrane protein YraQ (UPF0718 family)
MSVEPAPVRRTLPRRLLLWILALVLLMVVPSSLTLGIAFRLVDSLPNFATVFLGIFIEAVPYLFLGTLASGLVEVFLPPDAIARFIPRRGGLAALTGGLLGLFFPVCECGVIPLTRRLIRKGLPLSAGVAFLLAAPVLNPVVILSTAAAFGVGKVLWLRLGLSLLIAVVTGLVFSVEAAPQAVLREIPETHEHNHGPEHAPASRAEKWRAALLVALDEFFEMGRYLVVGALLAALMQTFIPQAALLSVGQGALLSVIVMAALAVLLSICSTVDAFVALGFVNTFSAGSILTFLVFGPMVDIKSILMYSRAFRPRPVIYLVLIPLLMSLLSGLLINLYFPGVK